MITTKPYFYDEFRCIASDCKDSCCIGWEIEIDDTSILRFKNEGGALGKKLDNNIMEGSFILQKDERCPFLKADGLCELICEKGADYICDICREHPRYYEWYGEYTDCGLGLCCEEACRLTFASEKTLTFISEGNIQDRDKEISELLCERESLFRAISNRSRPLSSRIDFYTDFKEILSLFDELNPFDEIWIEASKYIKDNLDYLLSKKEEFLLHIGKRVYEYEHLANYLIHRYYMKSLYTYFTDSVIKGIGIYLGIQHLFDLYIYVKESKFDFSCRIESSKYISKQLEYSEENIDIIMTR
ncbi:MAG: flagellin lysine-N-methylase [Clostridia bacterium]|nr:flagellin lysine-N-methylase [Clostridia bacterium]